MSNTDLPYAVEYAKSGRAGCKTCKNPIAKDDLRIATVVQSPFHDGKLVKWHHSQCFFTKQRPKSTADIADFDNIRWEDQQFIEQQINNAAAAPAPAAKGKKRAAAGAFKDFTLEYAKSNRAACRGCGDNILKGEMRISKKDYDSDDARAYGGIDRWHHLDCFVQMRSDLQFFASGTLLPGFKSLSKEDKNTVKTKLPEIKAENIPPPEKKIKTDPEDLELDRKLKQQNDKMYALRDNLSELSKNELVSLLEKNKQEIPEGTAKMLDALSDLMTFGALNPCDKCKGQLVYQSGVGYKCTGNLTEWTKCEETTQSPKRTSFKVPQDIKEKYSFLEKYKSKVGKRVIKMNVPTTSSAVKKEDQADGGFKIPAKPKPLGGMEFFIIGKTTKDKEELKKEITRLGGKVVTKMHENLAAVISNPSEVEKMNKRMEEAKSLDIQVVSEDIVEEAADYTDPAIMLINKKNICSWGGDPNLRISVTSEKSKSKGKSRFEKSVSGSVKLRVKGGGAVDPDSGLEDTAHIYESGKDKYTATLGLTDIQSKKNSFYKLQLLKHDKLNKYWLFRSWGRIGTTIGGNKLSPGSLEDCMQQFEDLYEEKSGNHWRRRHNFVKVPNKMCPVDLDYGQEDENASKLLESDVQSTLKKPVQDLIKLIFDVDMMRKVMLEFEIDLAKMPLGKLSKKQIDKAYKVLSDLQDLIKSGQGERPKYIDASNKFYTLIPHDFGVSEPTIIDTEELIQAKSQMLESLLELEIAYNLLNTKTDNSKNPLDAHYEQLNAHIDVLDRTTEEFQLIEKYVKNTHAATHTHYELEINDVFVVRRSGEDKRYKPFKKMPNKKLLWHGSRTTNFAGILSQGLRIAPPEAPSTGYMFGKGIYFADMVTKSANYCCTNRLNPTGLLLLAEVALGNMYERHQADYIEKLPKGKHSTLGLGQTQPDPQEVHVTKDGIEIPLGPGVPTQHSKKPALLYNEYIVYDVAQVQIKYLLKLDFKYKY